MLNEILFKILILNIAILLIIIRIAIELQTNKSQKKYINHNDTRKPQGGHTSE